MPLWVNLLNADTISMNCNCCDISLFLNAGVTKPLSAEVINGARLNYSVTAQAGKSHKVSKLTLKCLLFYNIFLKFANISSHKPLVIPVQVRLYQ